MRAKLINVKGTWREVADSARTTIHKESGISEPPSSWKRRMLMAEHSPIRQILIKAKWYDLPYWVSVHITRHFIGFFHAVRTQRTDRTGTNRDELPQGALVEHEVEVNAQALINTSRKRLCYQASKETTQAWELLLTSFEDEEPELRACCVRECVYRGFCPEYISCGYHKTKAYKTELDLYREGINQ